MLSAERDSTAHRRAIQSSEQLIRSAAELRLLTVETLLYREARSIDQWQRKIRSFNAQLHVLEQERPAAKATVARIRKNIESADAIHTALQSPSPSPSQSQSQSQSKAADQPTPASAAQDAAFAARNFAALTLVIQDVIDGASELSRARRSEELQTWRTIRMAVGLMLVVMLAQLVFTWRLTQGSILQPLATLVRATGRIAAGDYTVRVSMPQGDEIGSLAQAFNAMSMQVQRTNQAMRLEQDNLAITLDSIADGVIATDAQGLITRMNPVAERLTGWPLAEALGQNLSQVFHILSAQTRRRLVNPVQEVMARGDVVGQTRHTVLLARDGREYQIADSAAPIRDATHTIVGVVLVFSDVTDRYRTEMALARTTQLLERTGSLGKIGGWELNLQPMVLTWTLQTFQIAEIAPPTAPALEDAIKLYAPEARPCIAAAVQAAIDTGTPYDLELPMITAQGRHLWVHTQGFAEMRDGKAVRLFGTFQDITLRKEAENALHESETFSRAILDSVSAEIAVLNSEGVIVAINAPWQRFAEESSPEPGHPAPRTGVGCNYLAVCVSHAPANDHDV